jgi:site-specific recombinase XerC
MDDCNGAAFKNAVDRAPLAPLRWHDLRHTFASWALQDGATLPELKELGGWGSLEMVLTYAHLAPDHLALAAEKAGTIEAQSKKPLSRKSLMKVVEREGLEPSTPAL